jgi:ferredoxin
MAKIELDGEEREAKVGDTLQEPCEELGLPFGCKDGQCGTCHIMVKEGLENLSEVNEKEERFGFEKGGNERLACQCELKKEGNIKLDWP